MAMLTEYAIQQLPTPFMLDVCGFEPVLSNREIWSNFKMILNLQHVDNKPTTYQVEVVFQGDIGVNATLMGLTPNGAEYAICTTLQYYGYKSAAAAATLTVEPQSTLLLTTNKTPEQLQAEAENSGWLTIWHEFSWWPPWYRLHVKINIGNTTIDIGFNPILPGGETWNWQGLEIFAGVLEEIWQDIILDFMGVFISYTLAKGLSIWNLVAGLIAEGIKGASIDECVKY